MELSESVKCIISVTSYGKRMAIAHKAWENIIDLPGYHFVLTLYKDDVPLITPELQKWIDEDKMELAIVDVDYKFHKKWIHTMPKYGDKYPIMILDDDIFYTADNIESLYNGYLETPNCVIAHACRLYNFNENKHVIDYKDWGVIKYSTGFRDDIMPIHYGGAIYPPKFIPLMDFGDNYFFSDDMSLHAAAIRQGIPTRIIKSNIKESSDNIVKSTASCKKQKDLNASYAEFYRDEYIKSKCPSNVKAYLLTTKNSKRVKNGKIDNYPSVFPKPEVFYGFTPDNVEPSWPSWYKPNKKESDRSNTGTWCCFLSKLKLFKQHVEKYPYHDLLLIEDDVVFYKYFDYLYKDFMTHVPSDWEIIYFGGHHYKMPRAVNSKVLHADRVWGNECVLIRSNILPRIISTLERVISDKIARASDISISTYVLPRVHGYTPLVNFAGQKRGYSYIRNKHRNMQGLNCRLRYINTRRRKCTATFYDVARYMDEYVKGKHVDVQCIGGIGNCLYYISIGRWLRSKGFTVDFLDCTAHGPSTRQFVEKLTGERLLEDKYNGVVKRSKLKTKEEVIYEAALSGVIGLSEFFPDLHTFIPFDDIPLKPIVGVSIRRGDFLDTCRKDKSRYFIDLCNTGYYRCAANMIKELGLPVRIVTDDPYAIPEHIIKLFDNPEVVHSAPKDDFYAFAECQYKFLSNSTFSFWAAYATPKSKVYYPTETRNDIKLNVWTGIDIQQYPVINKLVIYFNEEWYNNYKNSKYIDNVKEIVNNISVPVVGFIDNLDSMPLYKDIFKDTELQFYNDKTVALTNLSRYKYIAMIGNPDNLNKLIANHVFTIGPADTNIHYSMSVSTN